jgi:hypothetical protein
MKKHLKWLDSNILTVFSFFLLVFIPLYPKLPLFEAIPGYIVRVRLEDIFLLLGFIIFLIQVIRKKATLKSVIFWPIVIYLGVGFLSSLSAVFITKTVPWDRLHILKLFLHWFRRVEYFSIFFIFYNGIKNLKDIKKVTFLSLTTVFLVSIYGYGQKYLYWPVYSTMNREFSKGIKLYLTEHARVPSTFGGHYDLAAYLVIFLTFFISLFLVLKRKNIFKWLALVVFLMGYWLLILTASRTSYIAYLGAVTVLIVILSFKKQGFKNAISWGLSRWIILMVFSLFVMIMFGDMSDRFAHLLGMPEIKSKFNLDNLTRPLKANPPDAVQLTDDIALVMDRTDERPTTEKPGSKADLPFDVYEDIPDGYEEATEAALLKTGEGSQMVPKQRTFSDTAYKLGLSTAIRLDALWPRAVAGFKVNPLLGSGYSTLTKEAVSQFTEAESTDNDYLRTLGETGILGFISFFAIIFIVLKTLIINLKNKIEPLTLSLFVAFIAFTFGLLVNALYIDVFEASKVAFMFWAFTGIALALVDKNRQKKNYGKK